ncbi:hypothetical protein DNTS_034974 [Danionella cerebrum]|uniref:Uncharacterized protein n=1 Tax=Danionella cerebrum TaxID=2873325 RepID=A0A553MT78_9TELE|nr:hypothetical protein DNTS_034974 [Danionella translucida]
MTTTTTFQGMDPTARSSSRVLRPPGGGSNICFGTDEEKPVKRNKMASSIFAEPEDPHAHRRNNPPGGKPTGVLCGEPSAPLRRCAGQVVEQSNGTLDAEAHVRAQKKQFRSKLTQQLHCLQPGFLQADVTLRVGSPLSSWAEDSPD